MCVCLNVALRLIKPTNPKNLLHYNSVLYVINKYMSEPTTTTLRNVAHLLPQHKLSISHISGVGELKKMRAKK